MAAFFVFFITKRARITTCVTMHQLKLDNNIDFYVLKYDWVLLVILARIKYYLRSWLAWIQLEPISLCCGFFTEMKSRLRERRSANRWKARCEVSLQSGRRRVRRSFKEREMHCAAPDVEEDVSASVTDRKHLSRSEPLNQPGFLHVSEKATVSVRMPSTGSEQLSRDEEDWIGRIILSLSVKVSAERTLNIRAESDDLLPWLIDCKVLMERFVTRSTKLKGYYTLN